MLQRATRLLAAAIFAAGVAVFSLPTISQAEYDYDYDDAWGSYDYYDVGYDNNYGDDWFYDYYDYGEDNYDEYYDYYDYGYYDYDNDAFDWEEDGLF